MRRLICLFAYFSAAPAAAHPGHIIELGGHDHWIAIGLIGAAGLAGLLGKLKGAKPKEEEAEGEDSDEQEEAPA